MTGERRVALISDAAGYVVAVTPTTPVTSVVPRSPSAW